jgi:hypothetical protein
MRHDFTVRQNIVNDANPDCRRHEYGHFVEIGFPSSRSGGNTVTGLRHISHRGIQTAMKHHLPSWRTGTDPGGLLLTACMPPGRKGQEAVTPTRVGGTLFS